MWAVRVHGASKYKSSKANMYQKWYCASLFEVYPRMSDGKPIYKNTGIHTTPTVMNNKAEMDGIDLAKENNAQFIGGVGSLHHKLVEEFV